MRWMTIAILITFVVVAGFVPVMKIYDDGLWPLSVTVRSASGQQIKGVSAEAFVGVESAQQLLAEPPPVAATRLNHSIYSAVQEPKVAEPLKVEIPTSETSHSPWCGPIGGTSSTAGFWSSWNTKTASVKHARLRYQTFVNPAPSLWKCRDAPA